MGKEREGEERGKERGREGVYRGGRKKREGWKRGEGTTYYTEEEKVCVVSGIYLVPFLQQLQAVYRHPGK